MREAVAASKLVYAVEPFEQWWRDCQSIIGLHWLEIAKNKSLLQLNVDVDYYWQLAASGHLLIVTARHADGALVGYVLWIMHTHPHYKDILCAQDDAHFLLPEYRRGMNGYLLLKNAMQLAKGNGAQYCYVREKIGHEHPAMMARLGLNKLDVTYSCDLTKWSAR